MQPEQDAGGAEWARAMAAHIELESEVLSSFLTDASSLLADLSRRNGLDVRRVIDIGSGPGVGTGVLPSTSRRRPSLPWMDGPTCWSASPIERSWEVQDQSIGGLASARWRCTRPSCSGQLTPDVTMLVVGPRFAARAAINADLIAEEVQRAVAAGRGPSPEMA